MFMRSKYCLLFPLSTENTGGAAALLRNLSGYNLLNEYSILVVRNQFYASTQFTVVAVLFNIFLKLNYNIIFHFYS